GGVSAAQEHLLSVLEISGWEPLDLLSHPSQTRATCVLISGGWCSGVPGLQDICTWASLPESWGGHWDKEWRARTRGEHL
uniref:Uncharacterized protein n=1 Tax=Ficedula albicollis TaxID=59894 RepID=A0A803V8K2_FICAL